MCKSLKKVTSDDITFQSPGKLLHVFPFGSARYLKWMEVVHGCAKVHGHHRIRHTTLRRFVYWTTWPCIETGQSFGPIQMTFICLGSSVYMSLLDWSYQKWPEESHKRIIHVAYGGGAGRMRMGVWKIIVVPIPESIQNRKHLGL